MPFVQPAPRLGNQYDDDRVLRSALRRILPAEMLRDVEPELRTMGELAGGELYEMQLADRENEPVHTPWNPWGERIDHIEVTPLWKRAQEVTAEHGVVATGYERRHGWYSRLHQFALAYLFSPSTDLYGCPLAMTDGAAQVLLRSGNKALADRAVPHLTSRDPATFWTSGQWMTESIGGSDAGQSQTVARRGDDGKWRLYGHKSFVSAATSQMALTLARPDGNGPGGRGLALFYLETRDERGRPQGLVIHRLKDKLGTRKVPTAEVELVGAIAEPVVGLTDGTKSISPMLNISRTWNTMFAVATMRRGVALARSYAPLRVAFGAPLAEKPLHIDTLAGIQSEFEGAFHLFFLVLELLGQADGGELDDAGTALLRLATSLAKLTTGKQVVAVASEAMECFGGIGYLEDTGIPVLLRDGQVLPIWEGTTNVLSLESIRALSREGTLLALREKLASLVREARDAELARAGSVAMRAFEHAEAWLGEAAASGPAVEAGARRLALTLGRSLELALLVRHAQWSLDEEHDGRARAAARRLALSPIDLLAEVDAGESAALANDRPTA